MLADGWRFMRDFLYVDNQHGAPWEEVWGWYADWLPDVDHRSDFNHLLDMLSGEVAVGHSYVRGGDYPDLQSPRTGLLGADLVVEDGFYRINALYDGESWNPGLTGPLAQPGLGVAVGDYIVEIDGRPLQAPTNPFQLLEGTAGRTITLTVNDEPSMDGAREIVVETTGSERALRGTAWVEGNRRKVEEMSEGRLAYVYLPNTGGGGYTAFNRMYFAQQDRAGAVIDERNNGGGSAADYMVDVMDRELFGYFNSRTPSNRPFTQPMAGLWGPKVMIINERAGSGGDLLPFLFSFHEVGPLVGTRTWGTRPHRRYPAPGGRRPIRGSPGCLLRRERRVGHRGRGRGAGHRGPQPARRCHRRPGPPARGRRGRGPAPPGHGGCGAGARAGAPGPVPAAQPGRKLRWWAPLPAAPFRSGRGHACRSSSWR